MDFSIKEQIAILKLDDGKANVLGHHMIEELMRALEKAEAEAKALLVLGRKGIFSGGFDLKEIEKGTKESTDLVNKGAHLFYRMFGYPKPIVTGCTGHAMAAGAFLLLGSDFRIGVKGPFRIGLNETAIGMAPLPVFGREMAENRLSRRHLSAAVIQSQLFSPEESVEAGFLDQVVDPAELFAVAYEKTRELGSLPGGAFARMKRDLRKASLKEIKASLK